MRYNRLEYWFDVFIRHGAIVVYESQKNYRRVPNLDPALIGKTVHEVVRPFPNLGNLNFMSTWDPDFYARITGAKSLKEYVRTSCRLQIRGTVHETRFTIIQPREKYNDYHVLELVMALSSRPPVGGRPVMVEGGDNPLLVMAWQDPEMLGQGILEAYKLSWPPLVDGLDSLFDVPEPKRRLALHRAALDGDVESMPPLGRRSRRKLDPRDAMGMTPLMLAAQNGHEDAAFHLLQLGADPAVQDDGGRVALHYAAESGHENIVRVLLERGRCVDPVDTFGDTPLHLASAGGHPAAVKTLIESGASPNMHDRMYSSTPLHKAARGNHAEVACALLGSGAYVDAVNERGRSVLHVAAAYGHAEVAGKLLESGADPNLRDLDGEVPLHRAAFYQHMECISRLLEAGADPNVQDLEGNTSLHVAASMNRDRAAAAFLRAGADIETTNDEGMTPLDCAVVNVHRNWGPDLNHLDFVRARGSEHNSEVAEALLGHGATIDPLRIPVGDRHVLWPDLTPSSLLNGLGDIDNLKMPELSNLPPDHRELLTDNPEFSQRLPPLFDYFTRFTILHDAVLKDMPGLVAALLDSGVDPNTAIRLSPPPLHVAVAYGNAEMAQTLLDRGADIERPDCNAPDNRYDYYGAGRMIQNMTTSLDLAAEAGLPDMVRFLLERGAKGWPPGLSKRFPEINRKIPLFPFHTLGILNRCPPDKKSEITAIFEEFGVSVER